MAARYKPCTSSRCWPAAPPNRSTPLSPQRSALQVAAFQGPAANASSSGAGTPSNGTDGAGYSGPRASASQLASVYVLPRALSLSQLAAMDEEMVQTRAGDQWQLRVHAAPSTLPGVSKMLCRTVACWRRVPLQVCLLRSRSSCMMHPLLTRLISHRPAAALLSPPPLPGAAGGDARPQRHQHLGNHHRRPVHVPEPHRGWGLVGPAPGRRA